MKKIIITLTVILAAMTAAKAQPRAVGISVGSYEAVTFQHMVYGTDDFFQLDLGYQVGYPAPGSMRLTATYNMILLQPKWFGGEWNFYVGPGAQLGSGFRSLKALTFGATCQVGLEYNFDFPLMLSAEVRPTIGICLSSDRFKYDLDGLFGFIPTISAKYRF